MPPFQVARSAISSAESRPERSAERTASSVLAASSRYQLSTTAYEALGGDHGAVAAHHHCAAIPEELGHLAGRLVVANEAAAGVKRRGAAEVGAEAVTRDGREPGTRERHDREGLGPADGGDVGAPAVDSLVYPHLA